MRKTLAVFSLALGLFMPTWAGIPVIDPANLVQNAASVFKQIEEIVILEREIAHRVAAAKRLAYRLGKWKSGLGNIGDIISQINSFRGRSRSIGYSYAGIAKDFDAVYGSSGSYQKNFEAWQKQSDDSIKEAMVAQGLIERSKIHMADLDYIITEKRNDGDQAATLQAIGEINAIQSRQLNDLSQMIATDSRAKQSVAMEKRSKEKELKSYETHLMKDFNKHISSKPLTHFPSLGKTASRR
jgi:P-type conjugative transfer protein TrbJ